MYDISVIIVNYNTTEYLRKCLKSISENLKLISFEIIVVDNNSTERSIENLNTEFPSVNFILRKVNDGFGSGCNYGAKYSRSRYLLFLNPDIILLDNTVSSLLKYLESNPDWGIVSGLMVDQNNAVLYSYNEFPSFSWELYQLLGFGYDQKIKQLVSKKEILDNISFETDWFHGAVFMISKNDFEKIGGFNEDYFMYYEDVEICYDSKIKSGKKNVCIPSVRVYHHTQSSIASENNDNIYIFHIHRSKIIFIRNYFIIKRFLFHFMGILYAVSRIIILPFWNKYKTRKKEKLYQLVRVLKLYLVPDYVKKSKYEYIK